MQKINLGKGVIIPTYACNLKCSWCYAGAEVFSRPRTMSFEESKKAIDFLQMLGIQTFTVLGGEPTVYHSILPFIEYAKSRNMGAWIVTHGNKMADPAFGQALVDVGLKGGCISIDGFDEAEHEAITLIKGSFAKTVQAIENSVTYGWPFYPMITVGKHNIKNVWVCVERLRGMGCKTIYINYGIPNIIKELDTEADASPQALAKLTEDLYLAQDRLGVTFRFNREKNKIPLCHFNYEILNKMFAEHVIGTGCEAAQGNTIIIEPGGTVLGCSHWVKHTLLNIYKDFQALDLLTPEEFWEEWFSRQPLVYRQNLRYYPYEQCTDCDWRKSGKCFGGCKVWQSSGILPKLLAFGETAVLQGEHADGDLPQGY